MKRFILLMLLTGVTYTFSFAQNTSKEISIVGTWRLIEYSDLDSATGEWIYAFGKNPKGYFTYTKNNIVNINISSEFPLKISLDSSKKYMVNLYDHIWQNSFGYFGTYSVDLENSVITHHVQGGCVPYFIDTDQKRQFTLHGDTLIISNKKTWRTVLVRAD